MKNSTKKEKEKKKKRNIFSHLFFIMRFDDSVMTFKMPSVIIPRDREEKTFCDVYNISYTTYHIYIY